MVLEGRSKNKKIMLLFFTNRKEIISIFVLFFQLDNVKKLLIFIFIECALKYLKILEVIVDLELEKVLDKPSDSRTDKRTDPIIE